MDLLFREYASPFLLLESVIYMGKLNEWIDQFLKSHQEKIQWECWLHKVIDKSWDEFVGNDSKKMTGEEFETTVNDSKSILSGFNPE